MTILFIVKVLTQIMSASASAARTGRPTLGGIPRNPSPRRTAAG